MKEKNRILKLSGLLKEEELSLIKNSYVGIEVDSELVDKYNKSLDYILGDEFEEYKSNKDARDGYGKYHITIIAPPEYSKLKKSGLVDNIEKNILGSPRFLGIGRAEQNDDVAYYIVVDFPEANEMRKSLGLDPKDFHITLGFKNKDVHGVSKDSTTIIG